MDNLLREYAGTHYEYDERGNQIRRWHNGQQSQLHWDLFDRLVQFNDMRLSVDYVYDALGRRLSKSSYARHRKRSEAGSQWNHNEQARKQPIRLLAQPTYEGAYDIDEDPLWIHKPKALPLDALAWYHCDHLGTPQELTDHNGHVAWTAQYKAWGEVTEQRSDWARQKDLTNPIRFQGQYHDHETGLHYNRHRYYDPQVGRFISKDPISYAGGLNLYA